MNEARSSSIVKRIVYGVLNQPFEIRRLLGVSESRANLQRHQGHHHRVACRYMSSSPSPPKPGPAVGCGFTDSSKITAVQYQWYAHILSHKICLLGLSNLANKIGTHIKKYSVFTIPQGKPWDGRSLRPDVADRKWRQLRASLQFSDSPWRWNARWALVPAGRHAHEECEGDPHESAGARH